MALTVPNTNRIRTETDSTVADALQTIVGYVNKNVTPVAGTRIPPPTNKTRPITPTGR